MMAPNERLVGEALTVPEPEPPVPVPESATESGVEPPVMVHVADSAPTVLGLKTMAAVQLADAARVEPQVVDEMEKLAALVPVIELELREIELDVLLRTVMVFDELLVPSLTLPKLREAGDAATAPPVPRPETATCCGLLEPLSVKVKFAVRVPATVGLKRMVTVQLEEAARLVPQVLV